jgi:hypothetical protein
MKQKIQIPQECLSQIGKDGITSHYVKITGICDFGDKEPSTAFFTDINDPGWYAWLAVTPTMHSTVLTALDHPTYEGWIMVDKDLNLLRLILYSTL